MSLRVPYNQPRLDAFYRNPANDGAHPDAADLPPIPRADTDRFQNWALGQMAAMAQQLRRLGKVMAVKDKTIHAQMETIEDLKFQLAEANARADRDGLTGLFNKAYFTRELDAIYQDNVSPNDERIRTADTILIIDLDGFKPINDNFGHAAGDRALCEVAKLLISCVRETDTVARLGGDEFGIILRGSDVEDAAEKGAEIHNRLNSLSFQYNGAAIHVRGSIGCTALDWEKTPSENLEIADKNMYRVKEAKGDTRFTLNVA